MKTILKLEYLALLIVSILVYFDLQYSWIFFIVLLFLPDLSMVGYLVNSKIGATIYNLGHTYISPTILLLMFFLFDKKLFLGVALIWFSHISLDRLLGYGLKHSSSFKDTHLGPIGKIKSP